MCDPKNIQKVREELVFREVQARTGRIHNTDAQFFHGALWAFEQLHPELARDLNKEIGDIVKRNQAARR
jgi:hypothetical protein